MNENLKLPEILSMVYTARFGNPLFPGTRGRIRYTLLPDGKIMTDVFEGDSAQPVRHSGCAVTAERMRDYYGSVRRCACGAEEKREWDDDHDGTLVIRYPFQHTETLDRGLTAGGVSVYDLTSALIREADPRAVV